MLLAQGVHGIAELDSHVDVHITLFLDVLTRRHPRNRRDVGDKHCCLLDFPLDGGGEWRAAVTPSRSKSAWIASRFAAVVGSSMSSGIFSCATASINASRTK